MAYSAGMLSTALRNRLLKAGEPGQFEVKLRNIRVNESVRGCSGFVKNLQTGKIVYVNTEPSVYGPLSDKVLFRTATSFTDYTGGRNQYGLIKDAQFVSDVVRELNKP